jgi:hypothetical protein
VLTKLVDQKTAFDRAIFVENKHRHVLHIVIERIPNATISINGGKKKKKRVSGSRQTTMNSLKQNCAKPSKRFVFHFHIVGLVIPSEARDLAKHAGVHELSSVIVVCL